MAKRIRPPRTEEQKVRRRVQNRQSRARSRAAAHAREGESKFRRVQVRHDYVNADDLAARYAEIPIDDRDLTARLLGDPPSGRSALGRHL